MRYFRFLLFILITGQMVAQQLFLKHHAAAGDVFNEKEQTLYRFEADPLMLATTNGFYIYDGIGCQRVGRKDQGASSVSTIWKDGETYWIGYEDGGIFQWKQQVLTPWTIPEGWPKVRITGFTRDSQGQHWTSTYGEGVYVFSHNTLYNIGTDDGLPSQDIYWIVAAGVRGVMVGTDRGLYLCHFRNGKKSIQKIRIHEELDRDIPLKVKKIPGTSSYIVETHESGVWQMNSILLTGKKIAQTETKNIITPALKRYYLAKPGTSTSIQEVFVGPEQIFTHLKSNLSEDLDISDMLVDEEGLLWLICKNNGLLSAPLAFKTYPTGIQEVQSILQVNQELWIGTESGLYEADLPNGERRKVSPHNVLCIMHLPHRHEIWAGTFGDGVIVMDENGMIKARYTSQTLLSNDNVFSMVYSGNAIWLASLAGIDVISEDGKRIKQINRKNGLPTDYIYTLFPDTKGTVWVGTDGEGVVAIHSDFEIRKYSLKNTILSFAEDTAGRIWFATLGNGVGILEQGNISMMGQNDGLIDLQISGLARDRDGNILSIHHSGIDIIDPTSFAVRQTGMQTGIQKWQMKEHAYYMNPEGFLYIPHNAQIIEYNTSDFKIPKPFVNFTSVKLGPLACSTKETIEATHDQHDLIANFSGVWLEHPESVVFRYMLDPVDKTWRYTKDQTIIYADLKPDRYRLTLECAENTHFMEADRKEISFVIQSPYWTRWWFILAVVAILVGGILTVARSRNRRRKEIAAIKTNQVKAELETLKSQINPHFLFNSFNTLISVIETNPKDAVHFVEKLSDFYRHMLQYRDTELITLKEEMEIQENYQYLLKMRFGEGIAFHIQLQANQNAHIIPLTMQLLSENAIKHNIVSRENPLNIYIQEESDWLVFKNEKRPRMSVEKSTYFGLKTLSARYRAIVGKDIQIQDEAGQFIVKIPLIYT